MLLGGAGFEVALHPCGHPVKILVEGGIHTLILRTFGLYRVKPLCQSVYFVVFEVGLLGLVLLGLDQQKLNVVLLFVLLSLQLNVL